MSSNWSGYVVGGSSPAMRFSSVSGSWVQPSVSSVGGDSYSVFWVGLGGSDGRSNTLEQIGTEASSVGGKVQYYAWFELVPSAPVQLPLTIHAGDKIYAEVSVSGTDVTVTLADRATGESVSKTLYMSDPDTSTAEWIAEAPSACGGSGGCRTLALANFGTVTFGDARATTQTHAGSISDPSWSAQAVDLRSSIAGANPGSGFVSERLADGAEPSDLTSDGGSFSVSWLASDGAAGQGPGSGPIADGLPAPPPGR